jgi:hypothetical protein
MVLLECILVDINVLAVLLLFGVIEQGVDLIQHRISYLETMEIVR